MFNVILTVFEAKLYNIVFYHMQLQYNLYSETTKGK